VSTSVNSSAKSIEIAAKLIPAAGWDASGDVCMIDHREGGWLMVVLGDIDDQHAARRAPEVGELIKAAAANVHLPCKLLHAVNTELMRRSLSMTAVVVLVGPADGDVLWASAGHPPPRRFDTGASLPAIEQTLPLGSRSACSARTQRAPADIAACGLLLHTDGVVEATGPHGLRFGEQRLSRALRVLHGQRAGCALDELMRTVCHFAAHALPDDTGAVVMRQTQSQPER
jgi:hypothetical protein